MNEETQRGSTGRGQFGLGLGVLALGLVLFTVQLSGTGFGWSALWPLIVVGFGLASMSGKEDASQRRSGLTIALVGVWLLINTLDWFELTYGESWPLLLILLGSAQLIWPVRRSRAFGFLMLIVGVWFQLIESGVTDLDLERGWPILIVFLGFFMVWRAFEPRGCCGGARGE